MAPLPSISAFFSKKDSDPYQGSTHPFPLLTPDIFPFPSPNKDSSSSKSSATFNFKRLRNNSAPETLLSRAYFHQKLLSTPTNTFKGFDSSRSSINFHDVIALNETELSAQNLSRNKAPSSISTYSSPSTHSFIFPGASPIKKVSKDPRLSSYSSSSSSPLRNPYHIHSVTPLRKKTAPYNRKDHPATPISSRYATSTSLQQTPTKVTNTPIFSSSNSLPLNSFRFEPSSSRPHFGSPPPAVRLSSEWRRTIFPHTPISGPLTLHMDPEILNLHHLLLLHQHRANQFELQLEDCKLTLDAVLEVDTSSASSASPGLEVAQRFPALTIYPRSRTVLLREQVHNLQQQVQWLQAALANYQQISMEVDTNSSFSCPSSPTIQELREDTSFLLVCEEPSSKNSISPSLQALPKIESPSSTKDTSTVRDDLQSNAQSNESLEHSALSITERPSDSSASISLEMDLRAKIQALENELHFVLCSTRDKEYLLQLELADANRQRDILLTELQELEKQLHISQSNLLVSNDNEYASNSNLPQRFSEPFGSFPSNSLTHTLSSKKYTQTSTSPIDQSIAGIRKKKNSRLFQKRRLFLARDSFEKNLLRMFYRRLHQKLNHTSSLYNSSQIENKNLKTLISEKDNSIRHLTEQNLNLIKASAELQREINNIKEMKITQEEALLKEDLKKEDLIKEIDELKQKLNQCQKENLQFKSELLQCEHIIDDLRIQHDQLVKELSKLHSQLTASTAEIKKIKEKGESHESTVPKMDESEQMEALAFKSLLSSMLSTDGNQMNWDALSSGIHRLQGLVQLMMTLEMQSASKSNSHPENQKASLLSHLERGVAKIQTYLKLISKWESYVRSWLSEIQISHSIIPGSDPQAYIDTLRTWYQQKHKTLNSEDIVSIEDVYYVGSDVDAFKNLFSDLPLQEVHAVWKILSKYPMIVSQISSISSILTALKHHFQLASLEKLDKVLASLSQQASQLQSLSSFLGIPVNNISSSILSFFEKISPFLELSSSTDNYFEKVHSSILMLSKEHRELKRFYECQKKYLNLNDNFSVENVQAKVLEFISLSTKLKQHLKLIFVKWKQSQKELEHLQGMMKGNPSFDSLQKAWKEVVKGVGCQLTENPEVVAKSLVQNLYNSNSTLIQLSEKVNQLNLKCDVIEFNFQQFKQQCKTVLKLDSEGESEIIESLIKIKTELEGKASIESSDYFALKKIWRQFNQDIAHALGEDPLDSAFHVDDQYQYWMHSLRCALQAKQQVQLNYIILQNLYQRLRPKIEDLGRNLNRNELDMNNVLVIVDEATKSIVEAETLRHRITHLYELVLSDNLCVADPVTKLDSLEQYLQKHKNYRDQYYQRRSFSDVSHSCATCLPNLKELIGNVATMPLIKFPEKFNETSLPIIAPHSSSLDKILNETLGQTEATIAKQFDQLLQSEEVILARLETELDPLKAKKMNQTSHLGSSLASSSSIPFKELKYILDEILNTKSFTFEAFERQKLLLSVKLREYLKVITDSQSQAFIQLQANHEAELDQLKLENGTYSNHRERDLRRLKNEIRILKRQLQTISMSKEASNSNTQSLSTVLSKTLKTLNKV